MNVSVYIVLREGDRYIKIGPYGGPLEAGKHRDMLIRRFPLKKGQMAMVADRPPL